MVDDADAHREEDKKFHELVEARNRADGLIHQTRQAIKEHGANVPGDALASAETALSELESAMKGDDAGPIKAKTTALEQAAQAVLAAGAAGAQAGAGCAVAGAAGSHEERVDGASRGGASLRGGG